MISTALIDAYGELFTHRHPALFLRFLPEGYEVTTLTSVAPRTRARVLEAKWRLGLLITLLDDFADHPEWRDIGLLVRIQRGLGGDRRATRDLTGRRRAAWILAARLHGEILAAAAYLPRFEELLAWYELDLERFFLGNRYSALVGLRGGDADAAEAREQQAHNMGMIAAGTLDLMGSPRFAPAEWGAARGIFRLGQAAARIANVLATSGRERREGDLSSAAEWGGGATAARTHALAAERDDLIAQIDARADEIASFSVRAYADGVRAFSRLHVSMQRQI